MSQWLPTQIKGVFYGRGAIERLPEVLQTVLGESTLPRVFIVTGTSLATKTPVIKQIESLLGSNVHIGSYSSIGQHAPIANIREAAERIKAKNANILLSVGGGSPIDSCKAIAYYLSKEGGEKAVMPHVAVPTTLSAAEFTQAAGYTSEEGHKTGVASGHIVPQAVIFDPALTTYTPKMLWLSSGIRALDHATECLYRKDAQRPIKHLAVAAIADLFRYLPVCAEKPDDLDTREILMIAAWQSLFPNRLATPLGISHLLGHELGATFGIPHGICSVLTLAQSVDALIKAKRLSEDELTWLARANDDLPPQYRDSVSTIEDGALAYAKAIRTLTSSLDLKSSLADYKVSSTHFGQVASHVATALDKQRVTASLSADEIRDGILERI